jgi:hypothetical protein
MEAEKGLPNPGFEQKFSAASYCQLQLPLCFTFCDVNHQCQDMSELCVVEPLWYGEQPNVIARQLDFCYILISNKFKALNTLLNSAE